MKKILAGILVYLLLFPVFTTAAPIYGDWAKESIDIANSAGILSVDMYLGDYSNPISRIEIAELIIKAYNNIKNTTNVSQTNPFIDTYSPYAAAVNELGIMNGRGDGVFSPYDYVSRQEMSKIILTYKAVIDDTNIDLSNSNIPQFLDFDRVSEWAKPFVLKAYETGIIKGYEDGTFLPLGTVSYQEAITLITRVTELNSKPCPVIENIADNTLISFSKPCKVSVLSEDNYKVYAFNVETGSISQVCGNSKGRNSTINSLSENSLYYIFAECNGVFSEYVRVYTDCYNLFLDCSESMLWGTKRITWNDIPEVLCYNVTVTEQRNSRYEGDIPPNTPLVFENIQDNYINIDMYPNCIYTIEVTGGEYQACKNVYSYSKTDATVMEIYNSYPTTKEEADSMIVEITVPVWRLNGNKKVSSKASLSVHKGIAEKVKLVFEEIYNGNEKFPIKDVGAYSWRGGTTEHNGGTAIDINSNENYCIYNNGTVIGSYWLPYEDPYSITPYGDVVRAFEKYGFTWGGDAWSNPKDYMHFSYLGT